MSWDEAVPFILMFVLFFWEIERRRRQRRRELKRAIERRLADAEFDAWLGRRRLTSYQI